MDRRLALDALTAAGFALEAESDLYSRPDDPRTANVFDEAIRVRTNQFAPRATQARLNDAPGTLRSSRR